MRLEDTTTLYAQAGGIRQIRNITITSTEIKCLIDGKHRLDSTTVNAVCAKLQADAEESGDAPRWCVFSSWLGPLVMGKVREGGPYGSILEHVKAAVSDGESHTLLAKTLWMIPLCSFKKPEHWVLGWIDFTWSKIGIFDSTAEEASSYWAEPLLLEIIDQVYTVLQKPHVQWDDGSWPRKLESPVRLQRQFDDWSCGLFVIMALKALGDSEDGDIEKLAVGNHKLTDVQESSVRLVLDIPIIRPAMDEDHVYDEGEVEFEENMEGILVEASLHQDEESSMEVPIVRAQGVDIQVVQQSNRLETGSKEEVDSVGAETNMDVCVSLPQKRRAHDAFFGDETLDVKRLRKTRTTVTERKRVLEGDEWVKSFTATSVKCNGCNKTIQLNKRDNRQYDTHGWDEHKTTCPPIAGKELIRVRQKPEIPLPNNDPKQNNITSFFKRRTDKDKSGVSSRISNDQVPVPSFPGASSESNSLESSKLNRSADVAKSKIQYEYRLTKPTLPMTQYLSQAATSNIGSSHSKCKPSTPPPTVLCIHLTGADYDDYIALVSTREFGGISVTFVARVIRQLFPYKKLKVLGDRSNPSPLDIQPIDSSMIPPDGNIEHERLKWTPSEHHRVDEVLRGWARWVVDYDNKCIKSTNCDKTTSNVNGVCDSCQAIASDESFKRSVRRKKHEASLSPDERLVLLQQRQKYANSDGIRGIAITTLQAKLKDRNPEDCFLRLFKSGSAGLLKNYERFVDVCEVLEDWVAREHSGNPNAKYGVRYKPNYINFMMVMRGLGQNSNRQFEIYSATFCGPSSRHLRSLMARSTDSLKNPALTYENVARVKRYADSISYCGPILVAGDNTKVKKRLNFSNDYGAHVLGTTYELSEVEVDNAADIDEIVNRTTKNNAFATQVRAIIAKIPLPGSPSIVLALIATNGTENANLIHEHHLVLQKMAAALGLPLIALAADGAASELSAQFMMDSVQSEMPPLVYDFPLYGIHLSAPVFRNTGPLISITDPPHARKTARNQPQYGTHTASLGTGYLVNQSLVDLFETSTAGLVFRDVNNVDKQDDGAARRLFHAEALLASTETNENNIASIKSGFEGTFSYLFVLGSLFEAWMNPSMGVHDRVLAALRARFWLHYWRRHIQDLCARFPDLYTMSKSFISPASFHIFNRLCDTLVLLALAYATHYPNEPFCIWLFATDFVEHFFGIARQLLPNFSYAEFVKMTQHIMVRQRILESGLIKFRRERTSAVGYIFNDDLDMKKLTYSPSGTSNMPTNSSLTPSELNKLVKIAHDEAVRICRDILHIPVPPLQPEQPLILTPLGAATKAKKKPTGSIISEAVPPIEEYASSDDDEGEDESDDEGDNSDSEQPSIQQSNTSGDGGVSFNIDHAVARASKETARYSALCQDLDAVVEEAGLTDGDLALPSPTTLKVYPTPTLTVLQIQASKLLDPISRKASIDQIIGARKSWQSGTGTKSERIVRVSKKYTVLDKVVGSEKEVRKIKPDEASHRLRIAQETNTEFKKQEAKKTRQLRWQTAVEQLRNDLRFPIKDIPHLAERNVTVLHKLKRHSFLIMRTSTRYYIGEVLDIYKKGQNSRYGSINTSSTLQEISWLSLRVYLMLQVGMINGESYDQDSSSSDGGDSTPDFSCTGGGKAKYHLHTHAPVHHVVYHLGANAMTGPFQKKALTPLAASRWAALNQAMAKSVIEKAMPALTIRIPGSRIAKTLS
ncbi:hypothetical protein BDN72DRAFT_949631 [Pluteus cervinus]|uniref:Uncharacterized protein n=1 Tax=Pluteus cervinus TaxID=181527 RepID=A0ACD3A070_9AGAR|nr:hypothetical protein BDN72DRAFT_949631 [Pluteus cervinus]